MVQSLTITPATATPISTKSQKPVRCPPPAKFQRVVASNGDSKPVSVNNLTHRRTVSLGMAFVAAVVGLNSGDRNANAARRPPPPPPEDRKDPNVSGVQAKVLASKKRKEAMKESMAKLREKGKPVDGPAPQKPTSEPSPEEPMKEIVSAE